MLLDKLHTFPALSQAINAWLKAGVVDGGVYSPSETGIAQGGVLSPLLMNIALHGMEEVVTEGSANGHARGQPLLVRYADDFVILHSDVQELQQAVRRVKHWLATLGLRMHPDKTHVTHTLTPYQGQVGFDFLGFGIRQESIEEAKSTQEHTLGVKTITSLMHWFAPQKPAPQVKTLIAPSQEASKRHLATIEQRLQRLQTASQAKVIEELNPLVTGWAAYYNGVVPTVTMNRYDDLMEQRLLNWASKRHSGQTRDWLLSRYWRPIGNRKRVFATSDGVQLRTYQQASILPW